MRPSEFFAEELAPSRRRIVEAARNATKATITTGLAAIMQIAGPFGTLFAFRIGQPGISLGLFEGVLIVVCAAAMQAAIVPITGKLLDYPGAIIAFLFVVFAMIAYLLSNTKLFLILALVAIGTITTVYVGIFKPDSIGWGSAYTFDGILVATVVMVAIDTLLWPSLPEPRLLESIAEDLERIRSRLALVGHRYLDPLTVPLPATLVPSVLARNLVLMKSFVDKMKPSPQRSAVLLDAITIAEHAYLEVERLAVLADEPLANEIRRNYRQEIELALSALDDALTEKVHDVLTGLDDAHVPPEWIFDFRMAIQRLSEVGMQTAASDELSRRGLLNLFGFINGLEVIGNLLEPRERVLTSTYSNIAVAHTVSKQSPVFDRMAFRFSVKLGATVTLGLLIGLTSQRADLQTILWSVIVAAQPNQYGAVVRKTLLRLAGCILGGLAALGAMVLVSENFDSLAAYLVAIFGVTMVSTYVAQSDEWLGYAGIQTGITFLICYVGLGPSSNVYSPLWRFWGIVLGVLTTGLVFLTLWPEYAREKVVDALDKLLGTILEFSEGVAEKRITEPQIAAAERQVSANLLVVLNLADQARLEGGRGKTTSAAAIESASVLIRVAYRFELIAQRRLAGSEWFTSEEVLKRQQAFEVGCCALLATQLAKLRASDSPDRIAQSSTLLVDLARVNDDFAASESMPLSPEARILLAAEQETYSRLSDLLKNLETSLSRIALS
jgi:uncharacterized membrane protein YccC